MGIIAGASAFVMGSVLSAGCVGYAAVSGPGFLMGWILAKLVQDALSLCGFMSFGSLVTVVGNYALLLGLCLMGRRVSASLKSVVGFSVAFWLLSNSWAWICMAWLPLEVDAGYPPFYAFSFNGYIACLLAGLPFMARQMAFSVALLAMASSAPVSRILYGSVPSFSSVWAPAYSFRGRPFLRWGGAR